MATFSKLKFSESTGGLPIAVAATTSPGTLIHLPSGGSGSLDEVWIYAVNSSTSNVKLTLEFGGTSTSNQIELTIISESGLVLVSPGLILQNDYPVRAFAGTANTINIVGYVNRIS